MSCVFKYKESKINTLSELREQGILDGPYLKDNKENEFNNYHNSLVESVQENYNLGINKFFNVLEQRTSSAFGISKKFVQPIDSSFKQLDQARKDLGIYDTKESYLSFKEASEAKSIKLNEVANIKPGVAEVFESDTTLANQVYEALGFKQPITQDDKSYYRGQIEKPTIDKDGNLVLYAKEDELYKKAGLKSKGVSMTDDLQSAIEYGNGQLEVAQNLASETYDADRELERLSENGYYLIQIPKNISNEIVKEAGEVKVIGDKIIVPKGQYKIEQVVDGVEQITPQQKQQATFLFSDFLDVYLQDYEQVEKILKQENIIQKKCN